MEKFIYVKTMYIFIYLFISILISQKQEIYHTTSLLQQANDNKIASFGIMDINSEANLIKGFTLTNLNKGSTTYVKVYLNGVFCSVCYLDTVLVLTTPVNLKEIKHNKKISTFQNDMYANFRTENIGRFEYVKYSKPNEKKRQDYIYEGVKPEKNYPTIKTVANYTSSDIFADKYSVLNDYDLFLYKVKITDTLDRVVFKKNVILRKEKNNELTLNKLIQSNIFIGTQEYRKRYE